MKNKGNMRKKYGFFKIFIAIILIITCCCCEQHVNDSGIVTCVKVRDSNFYTKDKKYRVTVSQEFNTRYKASCYVYTNKLYQVGDTIKIR